MIEHLAKLVVLDATDIGRVTTEIGKAGNGVGNGTAGHFGSRPHQRVDLACAVSNLAQPIDALVGVDADQG